MNKKVLVVVAHPDDEVLGCGGTIAKHINNGDSVSVLILADGETSRESNNIESKTLIRQKAAKAANQVLGVEDLVVCKYPDNRLDTVPLLTLVKEIEPTTQMLLGLQITTALEILRHWCSHQLAELN